MFRAIGARYLHHYGAVMRSQQRRALRDLAACRTSALGGHEEACDGCGARRFAYNSCRSRHCPKCGATARAQWLDARAAELLPVPYFHLVFTLPAELGPLALANQRVLYGMLFQAVSETLLQIAAQPKHLGGQIGFLAVLHTWGKTCCTTPICTVLYRRAGCRRTDSVGSPPIRDFSCQSAC